MGPIDFFVAGVQKGGTSALDGYLRRHPSIQMAAVKEIHFFDDESVDWSQPSYERLHARFDWTARGILRRGEATPIYLYWPPSLPRIRAYNPAARLVVLLRHPALRAFSQWRMETKRGKDDLALADALGPAGRRRVTEAPGGVHRVFSYVERGLYAAQIEKALRLFPRRQILFCRTDRLWRDPPAVLGEVEDFLEVERAIAAERSYVVPVFTWTGNAMPAAVRADLDAVFADDIRRTSALTGLDLSDWLAPDYAEPMAPEDAAALT